MRSFKNYVAFLAIFAMIFTSCSKDETAADPNVQETFQIQFGTLLNDFNKQQQDFEECRNVDPDYVLVALTDASDAWVAGKNPEAPGADVNDFIKINIKNNNGSWETEYSEELGLPAGTYQLQYFIVYSADDQVLWVAPREGGAFAGSVGDPLPQEIVLGAGTKPYIEVDVLCFIPRSEDAFGYIFFDINLITVENNYCVFVNFCDDGTGREYPALFEVDVWADGYDGSDVIVDGEMNSVSGVGNDFAATVLCFPLLPLEGDDTYFVRVTVLDAGAYDADASDFFEFEISQADIDAQLLQTPRYEHIRINCGDNQGDCPVTPGDEDGDCVPDDDDICPGFDDRLDADGDGIPDGCDECPNVAPENDNDGDCIPNDEDPCPNDASNNCDDDNFNGNCGTAFMFGDVQINDISNSNRWGWAEEWTQADGTSITRDFWVGAGQNNTTNGTKAGTITITRNGNQLEFDINLINDYTIGELHVQLSEEQPSSKVAKAPGQYNRNDEVSADNLEFTLTRESSDDTFWVIIHGGDVCNTQE